MIRVNNQVAVTRAGVIFECTPLRQLSTELTFIKTQSSLAPSLEHAEARRRTPSRS